MRKKIVSITLLTIMLVSTFAVIPVSFSATEEEIENAIELGVEWLANQQNTDGSWGTVSETARTGLAVLKLIDRARELGYDYWDAEYNYSSHVEKGLNYLFSQAIVITISNQTAGNPDSNNNMLGCYYSPSYSSTIIYESAVALMGIANTRTPNFVVNVSGSAVDGWTYGQVVQDTVDFMAYAQTEYSNARGGWGYSINAVTTVDNSVSGYVALGIGYAKVFGSTIPDFVYTELEIWISIIQDPTGYSWYRYNWDHGDRLLKTGNLLYEMALVGYPLNHTRVQNATRYIESHWNDAMLGPDYQRQYCLMKGLEVYGIDSLNVSGPFDWFDDIANWTIARQQTDGSFLPKDRHEYNVYTPPYVLTTTWALLTLEKAVAIPDITPWGMKEDAREILVSHLGLYDKHIEHDIEQAIWHIDKSMNPDLWVDDSHLEWQHGNKVFDEEKLAVKELLHIVEWKNAPQAAIDMACEVIDILVEADEKLATVQYDEATVYSGAHKQVDHQLALALEEFANAADELATIKKGHPKYDDAINAYNKAWQHAGLAIQHATK